jgi:putative addiction module antidote
MQTLKLIQIGNSVGVVLPKEILAQMNVDKGDSLFLSAAPNGMRITTTNPEFEEQMTAARSIMKKRRDVLAELAK